ncbi:MAG TPA: type II toxin-antitoxin system RelE/ParE family toxin [Steroidobacteraceae bacterium]|nr:type II toxin-antitoxin system RelE/ParE family toxin [Steroidobacteraceae bacterium]
MAQVVYAARALDQLERSVPLLGAADPGAARRTVAAIRSAVESLATHPLIGRCVEGELRELVISYGATGYLALYRFVVLRDQVRVLVLRSQRDVGFLP